MSGRTMAIIGAGFAGYQAARALIRRMPDSDVVLVNPTDYFLYLAWVVSHGTLLDHLVHPVGHRQVAVEVDHDDRTAPAAPRTGPTLQGVAYAVPDPGAEDLALSGELLLQDPLAAGRREQPHPANLAARREDRLHSGVVARPLGVSHRRTHPRFSLAPTD